MTIVIKVKELSKLYHKGTGVTTLVDEFRTRLLGKAKRKKEALWALKDVSFDVNEGEVVGIIGRNGAGKSTLLKILAGITEPTHGELEVVGRLGSLLEVGVGFHPNLSGRENVYLSGVLLGASMKEIKQKFDEIVEFSGVQEFLDTPVRFYSSGMALRLGFSVAVHLDQNIVMIDEALSVGDADFQRKCWRKLNEIASGGNTVVLVSHSMNSMSACDRIIYLDHGQVKATGPAPAMVSQYLSDVLSVDGDVRTVRAQQIFGNRRSVELTVSPLDGPAELSERAPDQYRIGIHSPDPVGNLHIFARFYDDWGGQVATAYNLEPFSFSGQKMEMDFSITTALLLGPGRYDARFFLFAAEEQQVLAEVLIKRVCHIVASPNMVSMQRGILAPATVVINTPVGECSGPL